MGRKQENFRNNQHGVSNEVTGHRRENWRETALAENSPPTPGATEVKIGDSTFNVEGQK